MKSIRMTCIYVFRTKLLTYFYVTHKITAFLSFAIGFFFLPSARQNFHSLSVLKNIHTHAHTVELKRNRIAIEQCEKILRCHEMSAFFLVSLKANDSMNRKMWPILAAFRTLDKQWKREELTKKVIEKLDETRIEWKKVHSNGRGRVCFVCLYLCVQSIEWHQDSTLILSQLSMYSQ